MAGDALHTVLPLISRSPCSCFPGAVTASIDACARARCNICKQLWQMLRQLRHIWHDQIRIWCTLVVTNKYSVDAELPRGLDVARAVVYKNDLRQVCHLQLLRCQVERFFAGLASDTIMVVSAVVWRIQALKTNCALCMQAQASVPRGTARSVPVQMHITAKSFQRKKAVARARQRGCMQCPCKETKEAKRLQ